jgi:hypothetical protein
MKNIKKGAVALLLFAICGNSAVFARKPLTAAEKARYQKYAVDLFIESRKKEQKVIEKAGNKSESIPVALSEVIVTHQKDEEVKPIVVFPVDSKRSSAILLDIDVDSKQELCVADLESDLTESSDEAIKPQVKKSKPVRFYRIKPSVEKIVFEDVKKLETKYSVLGRKGAEYAVGEALDDLLEKANEALKKSCDDKSVNTLFCEAM